MVEEFDGLSGFPLAGGATEKDDGEDGAEEGCDDGFAKNAGGGGRSAD